MNSSQKLWFLIAITLLIIIVLYFFPPIAQPLSFHHFTDVRSLWNIPNFGNVVSNLPFLFVGSYGLLSATRAATPFATRIIYLLLFTGVVLTGLGSAYYHWDPNNDTLVWDRLPMTIVFMSLLSATIAEFVSRSLGFRVLFPLVAVGIASVLWWHYTEKLRKGDLRLYFLVQYYPMLFIPLLLWLYYTPATKPLIRCLVWVVVWYVIAKVFEQLDTPIYSAIGISGHTLKHLAAAVSTWYFVVLFKEKYIVNS